MWVRSRDARRRLANSVRAVYTGMFSERAIFHSDSLRIFPFLRALFRRVDAERGLES